MSLLPKRGSYRCKTCSEKITWVDCPTGGWWSHLDHPEDNHDAIGPPFGDVNLEQFFDPDSPSGEPVLNQIADPSTGAVYGPGVRVDKDGTVTFLDG